MKKTKWLIYTVAIGLIPFLIRSFICLFDQTSTINYWLNESDFIIFGLILNLSNINELEDKAECDQLWKTRSIGWSVISIVIFSAIFSLITYSEFKSNGDINIWVVKISSMFLALVSFVFSYTIYDRINAMGKNE